MQELRDPELARRHVVAGLWLARVAAPSPELLTASLGWLLQLAGQGHGIPPLGFLADLGLLTLGAHDAAPPLPDRDVPGFDAGLIRRYEDYCLGKLYADLTFERASDAIARIDEAERGRAVVYLTERLLSQAGFTGIVINPAVIRGLLQQSGDELLQQSGQRLSLEGPPPELIEQYEALIACIKDTGDLLLPEDVFELEHGTALAEFGQRLALRQTLRSAELLAEGIARQRPRGPSRRRQVATRLLEEDAYPVGGFSSISTKGTIESLLHSQLVFLERGARPDLFDIKYVRDELLYYSRDENQFLRRRTTLAFVFAPDLTAARTKDAALPYQRIILGMGLVIALVRKLLDWLSDEAVQLHAIFIAPPGEAPLADEQELLTLLFADDIARKVAVVESLPQAKLSATIADHARRSAVECVVLSAGRWQFTSDSAHNLRIDLSTPEPHLELPDGRVFYSEQRGLAAWREVLVQLLQASV